MTGKELLKIEVDRAKAKGVLDIRPIFGEKAHEATPDHLARALAVILKAINDGNTRLKMSFDGRKWTK